jgi:hypothetical protein
MSSYSNIMDDCDNVIEGLAGLKAQVIKTFSADEKGIAHMRAINLGKANAVPLVLITLRSVQYAR